MRHGGVGFDIVELKGNLTFAKGIIFPKGKYCGYRNTSQKSQEGVSSTKATTYAQ